MGSRTIRVAALGLVAVVLMLSPMQERASAQGGGSVVISQIYGGGGAVGALFQNDFVELFNRGTGPATLDGMSIQYAGATSNFSAAVTLTGTLEAGQYYLVQLAAGAASPPRPALPVPDAIGTIVMSPTSGKVALVNSTLPLSCGSNATPCDAAQLLRIVDLVGYGGANLAEGVVTPTASNTMAAFRGGQGCADTNNNFDDFIAATPLPRNLATPPALCGNDPTIDLADVSGEAAQTGQLVVTAIVASGTSPLSSWFVVTADLSTLGGGTSPVNLTDNGVDPDVVAGDNIFTTSFFVDPTLSEGTYSFSARVEDDRTRSATDTATLTLTLPPDRVAPEFTSAAPNLQAVAVTAAGVAVTFVTPSATDNLDGDVNVSCLPASGSVFPLGTTTVTCTAQDFAGNSSTLSFTVTVVDNGNPVVTVPANMTVTAPTSAGTAVTFTATASDAIDPHPQVSCAPPSGSTFPVGATTVSCTATDASGNSASRSFTVTVTVATAPPPPPTSQPGHMFGWGEVKSADDRVIFSFGVRESARQIERGWVVLRIKDGKGRPDRYLATNVSDVRFSNAAGYKPGSKPKSGVDTVIFSGKGYWNGKANHRFEITATDRGEPGRGRDTFEVVIRTPGGTAVEFVSGTLRDGNIQSFR